MNREHQFAHYLAYLECQAQVPKPVRVYTSQRMAVAISRQTGSGAIRIAELLAEYLQAHGPVDDRPWTVFDKNLITKILEDQHLPARLAKFLPEDKVNAITDAVDEILGLHPPSWVVVRNSTQTILRLAELGNVILVGRGANAITGRLPNVLRVRLVGSLEKRIARIQELEHLNHEQARAFVERSDRGRIRYVQKYFHQDISDALLHDLTINTDRFSNEDVVRLIGDTVLRRMHSQQQQAYFEAEGVLAKAS